MRVDELTRKDIFKAIDKRTLNYSKKVKTPKYIGITKDYIIHIEVPSVSEPSINYTVKVKLQEFKNLEKDTSLTTEDKVRLSIDGDVLISCNCPAFKWWGYEYISTELGVKEGDPQTIFPNIRNPKLDGILCKHAYIASRYMGRWWKKISYDINNKNFI